MSDIFTIKTRRLHSLIALVIGAGLLFITLDAHFFHLSPNYKIPPWSLWWLIPAGLGSLAFFAGAKRLFKPVTLLTADSRGITIYSGENASTYNKKTKSWETTRQRGDSRLIQWSQIRDIKEGEIITTVNKQTGKPVGLTLGGTITGMGANKRHVARTLEILCDPSVKLDGFGTTGFAIARNGYEEKDLIGMSKSERAGLKPEDFLSSFVLGSSGMNIRTPVAIEILRKMQAQYSAASVSPS